MTRLSTSQSEEGMGLCCPSLLQAALLRNVSLGVPVVALELYKTTRDGRAESIPIHQQEPAWSSLFDAV